MGYVPRRIEDMHELFETVCEDLANDGSYVCFDANKCSEYRGTEVPCWKDRETMHRSNWGRR